MSTNLPACFWVVSVDSQIHRELHITDSPVPMTWTDIPPMTYAYMAIESIPSLFSYLLQVIVKNHLSIAFPTFTLKTT